MAPPLLADGAPPPEHFWEGTAPAGDLFGEVAVSTTVAPLLHRLGGFPFWRGESDFMTTLAPLYPAAAATAMAAFAGERVVEAAAPARKGAKPRQRRGRG